MTVTVTVTVMHCFEFHAYTDCLFKILEMVCQNLRFIWRATVVEKLCRPIHVHARVREPISDCFVHCVRGSSLLWSPYWNREDLKGDVGSPLFISSD